MSPTAERLRVGTRGSALALAQTDTVAHALTDAASASGREVAFEIVPISTTGDRIRDRPFSEIGPKGIFASELQAALLDGRIDLAVHSVKDLPATEPAGLAIAAVPRRGDARDVLVVRQPLPAGVPDPVGALPEDAVVGTSAERRRVQLARARPDLRLVGLRGNVDTRLAKVASGEVDAAVLAAAGLQRIGRADAIAAPLDPHRFVPAPGQGALAVEVLADRLADDLAWTRSIEDATSRAAIDAELEFTRVMEGGCDLPLGAWAVHDEGRWTITAFAASLDVERWVERAVTGDDPVALARALAAEMLDAGARTIIDDLRR